MNCDYEIGIIGGGPAGSTAAVLLAKSGFNVCLIEKKSFPRETLCGEFLSHEVIQFLKANNLFDEFLSLNPNPISSFRFFNNNGKNISADFEFTAYGLKRSIFDNFLLEKAKEFGAKIIQSAEIIEIKKEISPFVSSNNNNDTNYLSEKYENFILTLKENSSKIQQQPNKIKVKNLIAAYGKQNNLDKNLKRNFAGIKSKLNGIKFHVNKNLLNDFDEEEIQIFSSDGIYCGVNSVSEDTVTLCFLENRNENQNPPRQQLPDLMKNNKAFAKLFSADIIDYLNEAQIYGTGNIFFGKKNIVENGIYMIGDAAGVIAPLAGDGIGMAMESAQIISSLLIKQREEKINLKIIEELYKKRWKKEFNRRRKIALIIQKLIMNKLSRFIGFEFVYNLPSILPFLIKFTRK